MVVAMAKGMIVTRFQAKKYHPNTKISSKVNEARVR
jgi:hypothetical protein